jgi:hypothetical protein
MAPTACTAKIALANVFSLFSHGDVGEVALLR